MKSYVIRYRTRSGGQRRVTLGQHGGALFYEDAARLHGSMRATPYEANRTLSLFSAMLTRAGEVGAEPTGLQPVPRCGALPGDSTGSAPLL